ncbi:MULTISPECIES: VOC family protein [Maribacter]|uniref:VOC family protein n=1 Tax=Maribacter flavus TaxID=1658664 RepID=A0ABU7IGU0_9FLAO|nr:MULTISPECIES: VOC family protein [Maribacter]MDC6404659.1 VOC family protein [Maribacter sp. PR66]MEE1972073.1 VOC family protein [Maribacter flavus]
MKLSKIHIVIIFLCLLITIFSFMNKPQDSNASLRLELFSSNVERSVNFYSKILNFSIEGDSINQSYQQVINGAVILGIGPEAKLPGDHYLKLKENDSRRGIGVEIVLEVDDVLSVYQRVKRSGYPIHAEINDRPWGLTDFRLIDPDGYYIRITSRKH